MPRIDANIATQIADTIRPQQATSDSEIQSREARRLDSDRAEPRSIPARSEELKASAERLQTVIETASGRQLAFSVHERFKELVVEISDRKSGEILKEIPSKEFLKLRERLDDLIGLFIDEKI